MKDAEFSLKELQLFTNCSPKSKPLFIEQFVAPALKLGLIAQTHPNSPHHPRQKYYLTDLGKAIQVALLDLQKIGL